ncbi:RHS repeat-associated core domain-containing protein [Streptomyces olivoreticuli]|uniref:putative T7SS-secreted protein n=1 Tax=Streptomyces olivoreticuli TaxID=68246 RepID=UPI002658F0A6|nr:RHS repeat-associated core domain-containing protein [Streptomyces olivoreticuli]WKK26697.1 RHS repeat-associated core domain-containing protein [Streptomyces olivoreticuli]
MAIWDNIGDKIDHAVDAGKRGLGEAVEWGGHKVADVADDLGFHGAAKSVDDWSDRTASGLGAEVGEKQLDETDDPKELVHGDAKRIEATAGHLRSFRTAFNTAHAGMQKIDPSQWKGEGSDNFAQKFAEHAPKWAHAADSCQDAATALSAYAHTVTWAQAQAKEAVRLYKQGKEAAKAARDAYNKAADAYNAKVKAGQDPGAPPPPCTDPGIADREEAQRVLTEARKQRNTAAAAAQAHIDKAVELAPKLPKFSDRVAGDAKDLFDGGQVEAMHLLGGAVRSVTDMARFARTLNPLDPYNITHPAAYLDGVVQTDAGIVSLAAHPGRIPSTLLGDGWGSDPSEAMGRLAGNITMGIATGGGSTAANAGERMAIGAARRGATDAAEAGAEQGVKSGAAREAVEANPKQGGIGEGQKCVGGDPIDLATGRMFLPQTDVSLPAAGLPLLFERRAESGYRAGRWLGPSWSSTVDERLEIDSAGVVYVGADGMLLSYPHPVPGVPTLPVEGPRWPLADADGGYLITDPVSGRTRHFAPYGEDLALLQQVFDRGGHWITLEYDADGTPRALVHDGGYRVRITTDSGRITALHLVTEGAETELIRYGYTDGNLTDVINSSGLPLRFDYDERGRITAWTDRNASRYVYAYDDRDRCVFQTGTDGHMRFSLEYGDPDPDTGLRVTAMTDSLGHTAHYVVEDATSHVVAEIDPTGAATRSRRDRHNRLLSRTDALDRTTEFRYDEAGRLLSVTRPDGRLATASYDPAGRPVTVTDVDGTVRHQTFDAAGRRTSATDPAGAVTRFTYDSYGHLSTVTDALGSTTRVTCDAAGLPVEVTDPLGGVTTYRRDAFGRVTTVIDPLGATTRLSWTVEGRLTRRVAADGAEETWTYDGEGNCVTHTDALGGVTRSEYTHFDRLTARTGPDGVRYEFTHDSHLQLTAVTNPQGLTWSYEFDPAGRLASETDFDGRTLRYAHDAVGQLVSRTDPLGQAVSYERDVLGRVVRKDADGAVTAYVHDAAGRLLEAAGPDATLVYGRDRLGRVKSETCDGRTLTFAYDELGRRTRRVTPMGAVSTWAYDAAGRRTSMTASGHSFTMEHDAAGREIARHFGDALTLTHDWDPVGRLSSQSLPGVLSRTYTYRRDGAVTSIDDRTFSLDAVGRVTGVDAPGWSERYAYDEAGNQTSADWPGPGQEAVGSRAYVGTRITRAGGVRYEHDELGRVVVRRKTRLSRKPDTWRYEWDAEDRLTAVVTPDGARWRYLYDPLGRRIAKQRLGAAGAILEEVRFTWDGATLVEQTTISSEFPNPVTLTWDHDGLHPIAQTERISAADASQRAIDTRFFAIVTDLIGTPTELVDESGEVTWRARSTLWGTTSWATASTAYTPLRFPGQYFDPETGLHYNFHRHYDPESARYLSPDPLGLAPAPNPATYVHNPVTWADPLGLAPGGCPPRGEHLFRGTTPGFEGSQGTQTVGITPTSTDPGVATVFATHSEQYGSGVVLGIPRSSLDGVPTYNGYIPAEAEVGIELAPGDLAGRASFRISSGTARDVLKDMGIDVPGRIDREDLSPLLREIPKLTPEQTRRFIEEAYRHG